jgi:hypothetical protein
MQEQGRATAAVVALAGRRVDDEGTNPPRFPVANVTLVRDRLARMLVAENAAELVCSAACGADLIALQEAQRLGLRCRIVLPFNADRFRETSVVDRPGDWGPSFDQLIADARTRNGLLVLDGSDDDGEVAYAAANEVITCEAKQLAQAHSPRRLVAVVVWEGAARTGSDATKGFQDMTAKAGFEQRTLMTI